MKTFPIFCLVAALLSITIIPEVWAGKPVDPAKTASIEARVSDLLDRLTLDEKLSLLGGDRDFYIRPIPRLGLPEIKMADGPLGVRNYGKSTAYPGTVALAATWDLHLAQEFGIALGQDCRARGVHILLAPAVNIQRVPQNGRNFEYLSEDPYLAARFCVNIINGIQNQGVAATVKHYAANNQETERMTIDAKISQRALREIYLPAFQAAVQEAHVWNVMSAYNRLNGCYATANDWLNNQVLKKEWGFPGVLMSDWGATHETLGPANGGLDLEMPSGAFLNAAALKPLLDSGAVNLATINDKVRRILRMEISMGFLDRSQAEPTIPLDNPRSAEVALRIAREGTVLLKNENDVLPFQRERLHKLVVLGPNSDTSPAGGGSSQIQPFRSTSLLAGLKAVAGKNVVIDFIPGVGGSLVDRLITDTQYSNPIKLELFNGMELKGSPVAVSEVTKISEDWTSSSPAPGLGEEKFSARWTTSIVVPKSGDYTFVVQSDDGSRVFLDDKPIIDIWSPHALETSTATLSLEANTKHNLRVEFFQECGEAVIHFGWGLAKTPELLSAGDKVRIRLADAVVIAAGFNGSSESEGSDRTYALLECQSTLISSVAALNPNTVVVLNSGGRVATADWINKIAGLVQAWFSGQEGGRAVAEILFGDINPSGKLPFTFEKRWEDTAAFGNFPGEAGKVNYAEDIFVGYRWVDHMGITPLYPFGYGLSYTSFSYDSPKVTRNVNGDINVSFRLTNTGDISGAEVSQIYIEPPKSSLLRAPQELKGFARLTLKPGETSHVTVTLDKQAFAFFDEKTGTWKIEPGTYAIIIGSSSRDPRLRVSCQIP
ncbi:MAG: glycoside hydrolase family 3 C-terminal domain-containing protein [Candidatus Riflebacteria bacterium]|nr:glycoside hydrolase family 3 C-terminal domain-containing protein [Candidatus Riflebacteria bacterium]